MIDEGTFDVRIQGGRVVGRYLPTSQEGRTGNGHDITEVLTRDMAISLN